MVKFYVKTITITIGTNVINVVENNCYSKTLGARRNDDTTVRDTSAAPRIGSHFFPKYNFIPIQPILTNIFWTKFLPNFSGKFFRCFFRRIQTYVQNLTPKMIFLNGAFHIILGMQKSASIRIFQLLNKNMFNVKLKIPFLLILVNNV